MDRSQPKEVLFFVPLLASGGCIVLSVCEKQRIVVLNTRNERQVFGVDRLPSLRLLVDSLIDTTTINKQSGQKTLSNAPRSDSSSSLDDELDDETEA